METVGPEVAEQNQGDHCRGTGICGRTFVNAQDHGGRRAGTVGARGAWVSGGLPGGGDVSAES